MAAECFSPSLEFVLQQEGGYVDDPVDPGGATNLGITLRVLTTWRHTAVSKDDVKNLTKDEAAAIYRASYWNALHCDSMPKGIDLMLFDTGVNMGCGRSAKFLQEAVSVAADGAIGPATLGAVNKANLADLIKGFAERRQAFYQSLPTFVHFGKGWTNRVNQVTQSARKLAGIS